MPKEKIEKILLYNEQDVVNLYYIYVNWKKYIFDEEADEIPEAESEDNVTEDLDISNEDYENNADDNLGDETEEILEDKLS